MRPALSWKAVAARGTDVLLGLVQLSTCESAAAAAEACHGHDEEPAVVTRVPLALIQ